MTASKPNRIVSIQVCRGLAAILVVTSHLHNVEVKYCTTHWMRAFQHGVVGVDLFFVISGFVIASVSYGSFGTQKALTFLYHRFARVFPIYWIYTTAALFAYLLHPNWFNTTSGHKMNILASYLLIPTGIPMLIRQGWTLSFELYFYLIVSVLLLLASQRSISWMLAGWGAIAVAGSAFLPRQPILQTLFSPLVLEFLAGFAVFTVYRKVRLHPALGVTMIATSLVWFSVIVYYNAAIHGWNERLISENQWQRASLYGVFAVLFVFGAVEIERSGLIRFFHFLQDIGDWSYSIYLSHLIIVEVVGMIANRFLGTDHRLVFFIDAVSIPAVLMTGYLSYRYAEKPLMNLLYRKKVNSHTAAVSA